MEAITLLVDFSMLVAESWYLANAKATVKATVKGRVSLKVKCLPYWSLALV